MRVAVTLVCAVAVAALGTVELGAQSVQPGPSRAVAPKQPYVVTGCVSRAGQDFLITDPRGDAPTVYRIEGDRAKLELHVGHTLEIHGALTRLPAPAKPTPTAPTYTIKADTITWISTRCNEAPRPPQ